MPIACPRCQQANAESDERCGFCGAPLTVSLWTRAVDAQADSSFPAPVEAPPPDDLRARSQRPARAARGEQPARPAEDEPERGAGRVEGVEGVGGVERGDDPLQPAAATDGQAHFEVEGGQEIFFRGAYTTRVPLKGGSLLVGRRDVMANHYPDIDLMMYRKLDPAISRRHLRVFREGGEYYVEDLCNNNATFINDYSNKLNHERRALRDGDRVFVSMSLALIFRKGA